MKNSNSAFFYNSTQALPRLENDLMPYHIEGKTALAIFKIKDLQLVPENLTGHLSNNEKERMLRFRKVEDRSRFVYAHNLKRLLLASVLNLSPADLQFDFTPNNKPLLLNAKLHFNLSHSHDTVCVAINSHQEVGIDVEQVRESFDFTDFIQKNYHVDEIEIIEQEKAPFSIEQFFKFWSRKESLLKATGLGVFSGLNLLNMTDGIKQFHADKITGTLYHINSMRLWSCWLSVCHPTNTPIHYLDANVWLEKELSKL
ncbi:MAG: 4'-phosphopantetheinyl transferase superfamily protein [Bacteroidetes bacterium]|nr:4'-phosphopantetheinyl transferase superfamily protein [Bacteroidota bacterium]